MLAGPQFSGRGTGQPGYMKAAHWVAGKLAEIGLEPIGDNQTYFQMMPLTRRWPDMSQCRIDGPNGLEIAGEGQLGFERYTDQGEIVGEVVFVHFSGAGSPVAAGHQSARKDRDLFDRRGGVCAAPRLLARQRPAAPRRIVDSAPKSFPQTLFPGRRTRSTSVSGTILDKAAGELAEGLDVAADWGQQAAQPVATGQSVSIRMTLREELAGTPTWWVC